MVEWSITAVLKTAALRGAGGSNPSLSAHKGNLRVTFFRYVRGCLTPRRGFFQSLRFVKASLRAERESLSLRKGLMSKTLVRPFSFIIPTPTLLKQGGEDQTRRIRPDKEEKTKQGEGESIEEKEAKEGSKRRRRKQGGGSKKRGEGSKKLGGSKAGRRSGIDKKRMTPNLHWKSSFVRPQGLEPWTH